MSHVTTLRGRDVVVIGGGLVGLASALAMADQGIRVALIDDGRPGQASRASGGVLAPSIDPAPGAAGVAAVAALARYPAFLDALHDRTGLRVPLGRGVLEVARSEADGERLRSVLGARRGSDPRWRAPVPIALPGGATTEPPLMMRVQQLRARRPDADARWLAANESRAIEPAIAAPHGAVIHPRDGWVDARALLTALERAVAAAPRITVVRGSVVRVRARSYLVRASLADGTHVVGRKVVIAAGAWAPLVAGLGREIAVRPLRGQMIAVAAPVVRGVVFGAGGYLVPDAPGVLVGATSEPAGFDPATTPAARLELRTVLATLAPDAAHAPVTRQWAGLRPMTADGQPLVGRDWEGAPIVYACGHSRNGVLLAPLTAACVTALMVGAEPPVDIRPFAPGRFDDPAGTPTGKNAFDG